MLEDNFLSDFRRVAILHTIIMIGGPGVNNRVSCIRECLELIAVMRCQQLSAEDLSCLAFIEGMVVGVKDQLKARSNRCKPVSLEVSQLSAASSTLVPVEINSGKASAWKVFWRNLFHRREGL